MYAQRNYYNDRHPWPYRYSYTEQTFYYKYDRSKL
mgnify:CR=1 FL=1